MLDAKHCIGVNTERIDEGTDDSRTVVYTFDESLRIRTVQQSINTKELTVTFDGQDIVVSTPLKELHKYEGVEKIFLVSVDRMIKENYQRQHSEVECIIREEEDTLVSRLEAAGALSYDGIEYDAIEVETSDKQRDLIRVAGTRISGYLDGLRTTLFEEHLQTYLKAGHRTSVGLLKRIYQNVLRTGNNPSQDMNYSKFVEADGSIWLK